MCVMFGRESGFNMKLLTTLSVDYHYLMLSSIKFHYSEEKKTM